MRHPGVILPETIKATVIKLDNVSMEVKKNFSLIDSYCQITSNRLI